MKLTNFEILEDGISLKVAGEVLDLHNNYEFLGFEYKVAESCRLYWKKSVEPWAAYNRLESFEMVCSEIEIFRTTSRDPVMPLSEDRCLELIGFLHPEDIELMNGFLPLRVVDPAYHLILAFHGGVAIKILAKTVTLEQAGRRL